MSTKYTLRVRCASWDALESFYLQRVRPGALLGARVPFVPQSGDQVTVALELPDGIVFAIDGVVRELGETVQGRTPIMLRLIGFDSKTQERLEEMVWQGRRSEADQRAKSESEPPPEGGRRRRGTHSRPPPPTPHDAPLDIAIPSHLPPSGDHLTGDAAKLLAELRSELVRLNELGARDVVGVGKDAKATDVRTAYFALVRRFHPDVVSRYRSPALSHAASELSIFVNRAYDRVRSAVRAAGGKAVAGPAIRAELGWLIDIGDIEMANRAPAAREPARSFRVRLAPPAVAKPAVKIAPRAPTVPLSADSLFDDVSVAGVNPGGASLASKSLDESSAPQNNLSEVVAEAASAAERGELETAAQLYADALGLDPRDRKLRARYHATRGKQLLDEGDRVRATTQLELALTHDPDSRDAKTALAGLRQVGERKRRFSNWFKR